MVSLRATPKQIRSLRYHTLKGGRRGEHAVKLTGFYRLIFTMVDEQIDTIRIEEVSKHYGD